MNTAVAAENDRLMLAVIIASALHVLVIFGISFDSWQNRQRQQQVEVTLVQKSGPAPTKATHVAQVSQSGDGSEAMRDYALSEQRPRAVVTPDAARAAAVQTAGQERERAPAITSENSLRSVSAGRGQSEDPSELPEAERELARLQQELARLRADLRSPQRPSDTASRVRRVNSVAALAAVDAEYLAQWRRRVEAVGNSYYPEASLRYGIYGSLEMLVTVRSDGSLEDIRILQSSGHAVLDEAAIRIVRAAAPFAPFPSELRASTERLEILRTWQFEQNPLSSN